MTPEEKTYVDWRRQAQVGCMFARVISGPRRLEFKQTLETVRGISSHDAVADHVAKRIDALVANPKVDAAAFIFPELVALSDVARVFLALGALPSWTATAVAHDHPTEGKLVAIGLHRQIPFQGGTCPSEALVLGPFDVFPNTRKAPLVALEIFVGIPRQSDPKDPRKPTTKANLAHMDVSVMPKFERIWDLSEKGRKNSLGLKDGEDDVRAKAKVAFVIPEKLANKLGCLP